MIKVTTKEVIAQGSNRTRYIESLLQQLQAKQTHLVELLELEETPYAMAAAEEVVDYSIKLNRLVEEQFQDAKSAYEIWKQKVEI